MHKTNTIDTENLRSKYKIFIIDDNEGLCRLIQKTLNKAGYKTDKTNTGEQALKNIKGEPDEVLLLDYKLPDFNGKELVEKLKEENGSTPNFLVMTGYGDEKIAVEMMKMGAKDYILKESDFVDILLEKINKICAEIEIANQLESNRKILHDAEQLAGVGGWLWHVKSDEWVMSDNWMALHGCSEKSFSSEDLLKIAHPDDAERINKAFAQTLQKGTPYQIEHRIIRQDNGKVRHIKASGKAEFDNEGNVVMVSGAALDITDRVLAEAKQKKSYQNLQSLLELATIENKDIKKLTDYVLQKITDITGSPYAFFGFLDEHERILSLYSWSENAMKNCKIEDKPFKFPIRNAGLWARVVSKRKPILVNDYNENISGKKGVPKGHVEIERFVSIPVINKGKVVAVAAVANKNTDYSEEDITILKTFLNNAQIVAGRIQAEESLRKSEEKYRSIFENSALGIFRSTPEGRYEEVNEAFARILGFDSPQKMMDEVTDISQLYKQPKDREKIIKAFADKGFVEDYEVKANHPSKNTVWISIDAKQQQKPNGSIYFDGTIQDITEKKNAEDKLKESREEIGRILENSMDGILLTAPDGSVYSANPAACKMFGRSEEEICELGRDGLVDLNDWRLQEFIKARKEKGNSAAELNMVRKDGTIFPAEISSSLFKDKDGNLRSSMIIRDITERKKADQEIKENERRLELRKNIAEAFVLEDKSKMYHDVLQAVIKHFSSRFGYFGYIDQNGDLLCPSMTYNIWEDCEIENKSIVFPKSSWAGIWGESLKTKSNLLKNSNLKVPEGHVQLKNAMVGVIQFKGKLIGQLAFANCEKGYTQQDLKILEEICQYISPLLNAEIKEDLHKKELIKAKEQAEENEKKLIEAQEISHVGSWEYIVETDRVTWSKELSNIFERSYDLPAPKYSDQKPFYSKESFEKLDKALQECIEDEIPYEVELDVITSSGSIKHIISKGNVKKDANNKVIGAYGTAQDITPQKKLEQELISAKEKAEESDQLKSAFLANMSHEIRTPMNGILGFTDLLAEENFSEDERKGYIDIIKKNGDRLIATINDLIDISKIESGQVSLNYADTDVDEQVEDVYTFFKSEAKNKGLELMVFKPDASSRLIVETDKEKLYSILTNLVKNALKYTRRGRVSIGYYPENDKIRFYVKDTGIGIPKEKQQSIFNRFIQAELSHTREFEGSGLGLSITRAYVEMLGGEIFLNSKEGAGSTFSFTIPLKEKNKTKVSSEKPFKEESNQVQADLANLRILIVDDEETSRMFLHDALKSYCKNLDFASNGKEALEKVRANDDYDVILMDIKMPLMDGHEATRNIREFNKKVIIIAQTAFAMEGDREKALQAGCDDYITKPIMRNALLQKINKLFLEQNRG